ncbi:MAG: lipopolysaccharide biosynthesis protein [Hyphomicrobiales bacterium]|nr:lipopolysaccharide biosynthesis protein [Hyphomicrobiales bacterium]
MVSESAVQANSFQSAGRSARAASRSAHANVAGAGDELDLPGIGHAIVRRKKLIFGVTCGCLAAALAFLVAVKPTYTGDARVLIENQESYFTQPEKTAGPSTPAPDAEAVASQVELIKSRDVAREAIRQLGLKGNPEFDPLASGQGIVSRILMMAGLKSSYRQLSPEDRILKNYSKKLMVFESPKSRVVNIQFSAKDPKLAARGANTIADLYISMQQKAKKDRARVAALSLGSLIADLRSKLAAAEGKVEAFRARTGLMVGANNALIPSQLLAEINTQLATARTNMADAQAKAQLIRSQIRRGRLGDVSEVSKDENVRRIVAQRSSVRAQLASESRTLGPAHPRIKEIRAQLVSVENELRNAALKAARGLENDAKIAMVRVQNLQAAISNQQAKVGATSSDQVKLREYELEAKLIKDQLESNLTKYREALARQNALSTPGDARIVSRAFEPVEPSFPKKLPVTIFATLAGFILSLGFVISSELLSGRAFVSNLPPDGDRPFAPRELEDTERRLVPANDEAPAPSGYPARRKLGAAEKRLTSRISAMKSVGYGQRIVVCAESAQADHAAAIEPVARALSSRHRVILADLTGRMQAGYAGLSELLEGLCSFGQAIERDAGSRLHVISRGAGDVPIGEDFDAVLEALSQTYDFIFIVLADEQDHSGAFELAGAADLVLVGAATEPPGEVVEKLRESLEDHGAGEVEIIAAPRQERPRRRKGQSAA